MMTPVPSTLTFNLNGQEHVSDRSRDPNLAFKINNAQSLPITPPDDGSDEGKQQNSDDDDDADSVHLEYDEAWPSVPKTEDAIKKLDVDSRTPDAWVERDERMIRLTGKHPLNVEAPLADLWNAGFLTPQNLFYVRNHGAVPQVDVEKAQNWRLEVHGLCRRPTTFSIDDLKRLFPTISMPVTLVCAGNRRGEQIRVKPGLGFFWGAAGVSTGIFTGVRLSDILDYVQPIRPVSGFPYDHDHTKKGTRQARARHVIFEGTDELPNGKYGTSQRIQWCRDPMKGMMICWGLNGELLTPDHGFPLRLIVPGQIGGRMVKWLNRIEIAADESQHYLHFKDNKVLPTQLTADMARSAEYDSFWKDPKYIINDLNVNAAMTVPDHNEILQLKASDSEAGEESMYQMQGYAYTGGGKRVHRVELSFDEGVNWELAEVSYPEDIYRVKPLVNHPFFGTLDITDTEMSWCWCFWSFKVPRSKFADGSVSAIFVRATDEGLAAMPRDMYWNATCMMNNWWFRVAVHKEGEDAVRFEHPTLAAAAPGGWMERLKEEGQDILNPVFGSKASALLQNKSDVDVVKPVKKALTQEELVKLMTQEDKCSNIITREQLKAHTNEEEPWFTVHGHVYDGTPFLKDHPGGAESITIVAGEDATEDFMAIHSLDGKKQLAKFHIGKLEEGGDIDTAAEEAAANDPESPSFLHPKFWKKSLLVSKTIISHDSRILRFKLSRDDQDVGLPVGQHVYFRLSAQDPETGETETVQRAYTPFSGPELRGYLDVLIKVYFPSDGVPKGGRMTTLLDSMKPGEDMIEMKGPLGHFTFLGASQIQWKHKTRKVRKLACICGGSGLTPIWSTLSALVRCEKSVETEVHIINVNRTEEDILAREHLEEVVAKAGGRVKLYYTLTARDLPDTWTHGRGRISLDDLRTHLPPPPPKCTNEDELEDTLCLICGPPAMEKAVTEQLVELGWDVPRTVVFF
ncbi:hypothetical protein A4X09_0g1573 [Tilletia walkeri]|uniref:Nitrate reductase [NADPH] n=1 Tax=Tilletia walkeri TaxID=117179 RepID=A0A8X7NCJ5_9BASI|nr:hypothetical protein A4X09_0g1573 [Tilletia walkeri]